MTIRRGRKRHIEGRKNSLDAVAENTLGLINQAAAQASENIKTAYASAQKLSANLDAAQARIQELESSAPPLSGEIGTSRRMASSDFVRDRATFPEPARYRTTTTPLMEGWTFRL